MQTTREELQALAALLGGVDAAADSLGIDEDLYQRALDGDLSRREMAHIDKNYVDYVENETDLKEQLDAAVIMFEYVGERNAGFVMDYLNNESELSEKRLNQANAIFFNLTPEQEKVFFNHIIEDKDFIKALDAFVADGEDISRRPKDETGEDQSEFWKWFRDWYE